MWREKRERERVCVERKESEREREKAGRKLKIGGDNWNRIES